jgi:hypothetical protein
VNRSFLPSGGAKLLGCALVLATLACADHGVGPDLNAGGDPDEVIFLAQNELPAGYMEALYRGPVALDEKGCLRLSGGVTVIWPYGATLQNRDGELHVRDPEGRVVGKVGGNFHMGGGYVPLTAAVLSAEDRARAENDCPSADYWVAGEMDPYQAD